MNYLPEQTPEERAERIAKAKLKEAEQDQWVKDNGYVLERDSCADCLKKRETNDRNYTGDRMFCGSGHAYEIGQIKRGIALKNLRKEIVDTIYELGSEGVRPDENTPKIKELLDRLEETYY